MVDRPPRRRCIAVRTPSLGVYGESAVAQLAALPGQTSDSRADPASSTGIRIMASGGTCPCARSVSGHRSSYGDRNALCQPDVEKINRPSGGWSIRVDTPPRPDLASQHDHAPWPPLQRRAPRTPLGPPPSICRLLTSARCRTGADQGGEGIHTADRDGHEQPPPLLRRDDRGPSTRVLHVDDQAGLRAPGDHRHSVR